ncbi:MAG: dihydropteroate synthase [Filimonas sp.]|nr:dihydropteroate synthase [Filimonas sp.]
MFTLNCKGRLFTIDTPVVMGIINSTPDSFFSGSRQATVDDAVARASQMIADGASILDIGGLSTRPGSEEISADEEAARVTPVIAAIKARFPDTFISIDTYRASVAKEVVAAGADIINDISGGLLDEAMLPTTASLHVPFICMHMKGTPQTMPSLASYDNVVQEVLDFLIVQTENCRKAGIQDVILDPGIGFAKTIAHNFELVKNLSVFSILQRPILLGISRKSMIYKTLHTTPENALNGTTVLHTAGLLNGAHILRVHDVKEAVEAVKLCGMLGVRC